MAKTRRPKYPLPGTRLPLALVEDLFPTDRDFALAFIAEKIQVKTAQDGMLGPVTIHHIAEVLDEDFIRPGSRLTLPGGNWRTGVVVEFTGETRSSVSAKADTPSILPAQEEAATPVPGLTLEQRRELTPEQIQQRHKQAHNYRKHAVAQIRAEGKVPATPGYSVDGYVIDVRTRCGLHSAEKVRGFGRRRLREMFNSLE
jgi:hypothetical protein